MLRQLFSGRKSPVVLPLEPIVVEIDGKSVTVKLKRHAAARRMVLRLARDGEGFAMTLPKRQSISSAKVFLEASQTWMQNTLARRGRKNETAVFMLHGVETQIVVTERARGLVVHDGNAKTLTVPGGQAHWKRRLTEWLKREAEAALRKSSSDYATKMCLRFSKLTVRDQKSRWGSCSDDGALSYSWRLILAPEFVLDYVAAHEVAHLKEMNHGPRFWRLVLTHCARTREAQTWLKVNGHQLHHVV
jgi:predicted metal-dependent hydrolase